jgi:hypothetical protein
MAEGVSLPQSLTAAITTALLPYSITTTTSLAY